MRSYAAARFLAHSIALALIFCACDSDERHGRLEIVAPESGAELTAKDDVDGHAQGLQYDVRAEASGMVIRTIVVLKIDGELQGPESAVEEDGSVHFPSVTLPPGTHRLQVQTKNGSVKSAADHEYTFEPEACPGDGGCGEQPPACELSGPKAIAGSDAAGKPARYLGAAQRSGEGFDLTVETDERGLGGEVELIIDGDEASALAAEPEQSGQQVRARFAAVPLADGPHTLQARCTGQGGEQTTSESIEWIVDTEPCAVTITSPADDTEYVDADDADAARSGTQVELGVAAEGGDCVQGRAAVCDPDTGTVDADFVELDGASSQLSATLQSGTQTLCVEVQDRAGNTSGAQVKVALLRTPEVAIESPQDGTMYNAAGGGAYVKTSDPASSECAAEVLVACSVLDAEVELRHQLTDAAPIAAATCEAPADGDPELPDGFAGRARFTGLRFLPQGEETATLVATQSVKGSGKDAVGVSELITLHGDCAPPEAALAPDFCAAAMTIAVDAGDAHVTRDIDVADATTDAQEITLHVTNAGGAIDSSTTQSASAGGASFQGVDLGTADGSLSTATLVATVTDDFGNSASKTCSVDIATDVPMLVLTTPADAAAFGIGAGCDSGMPGVYGVALAATADRTADRSATVTAGAFTKSYGPPLAATAISDCVPAVEGSNSLQLALASETSGASVSASVSFVVDTLSVSAPAANAVLDGGDTCATGVGSETGITASVSTDAIHDGRTLRLQAGSNRAVTTTLAGGAGSACIPVSEGSNTLTAAVLGASSAVLAMESVSFTLITGTPTHGIAITSVTLPPEATYRSGEITLGWSSPAQDFTGQLTGYALRCATTPLDVDTGAQNDWDAWWTNATVVDLPSDLAPSATSAVATFRIGETQHCELRAADALGQLTPLVDSTKVEYPFRQHKVTPASTGQQVGRSLAAIGDVDGDGVDDVLIGGKGEAELVFGSPTPWVSSGPDVVFQGASASTFGQSVTGLGDFNGDGMDDFAIAEPWWTNPNGNLSMAGRVLVFFGRASRDWPASIDLRGACAADLCFENTQAQDSFGWTITGAGDFNDDGVSDLAIAAVHYPAFAAYGRVYVVLGKAYEEGMTKPQGQQFWQLAVDAPGGAALQGFVLSSDGSDAELLGYGLVGVGNYDKLAGDDLIASAVGFNATTDRSFFLSGRSYVLSVDSGLKPLTTADFGFVSQGTPSGQPLDVATSQNTLGFVVAVLGNAYDVPGAATTGRIDIAVQAFNTDHVVLYPGDNDFDPADQVLVAGAAVSSDLGTSIANGYSAALGRELGDLDGDGKSELCAAETLSSLTGSAPGEVLLWYSDVVQDSSPAQALSYTSASPIAPPAGAGTTRRVVEYVGDLNADGAQDLVVGSQGANSKQGELTILY